MKNILASLVFLFVANITFAQGTVISENEINTEISSKTKTFTLKANNKALEGDYIVKTKGGEYKTSFKKGKIDGDYNRYNKDGKLLYSQNYSKGILSGEQKLYYPDGKLMETYTLVNGLVDGFVKVFDKEGKVIHERYFEKGVEVKEAEPVREKPVRIIKKN